MSAILKFDFQKRDQLRFSEVNYLNYKKKKKKKKKKANLHVATTFSLKQGETRTNHGPIPHPLRRITEYISQMQCILAFWVHRWRCLSSSVWKPVRVRARTLMCKVDDCPGWYGKPVLDPFNLLSLIDVKPTMSCLTHILNNRAHIQCTQVADPIQVPNTLQTTKHVQSATTVCDCFWSHAVVLHVPAKVRLYSKAQKLNLIHHLKFLFWYVYIMYLSPKCYAMKFYFSGCSLQKNFLLCFNMVVFFFDNEYS